MEKSQKKIRIILAKSDKNMLYERVFICNQFFYFFPRKKKYKRFLMLQKLIIHITF